MVGADGTQRDRALGWPLVRSRSVGCMESSPNAKAIVLRPREQVNNFLTLRLLGSAMYD